jgi:predicted nucleic acid-binding Zn ribbon protein
MRFDTPKSIGESLRSYLDKFPQKKKLRQGMVLSVWKDVVGERIASQVSDIHFENGKLIITVSNQVWRHEIHANRFSIAKRLNTRVKSQVVGDIIVRS